MIPCILNRKILQSVLRKNPRVCFCINSNRARITILPSSSALHLREFVWTLLSAVFMAKSVILALTIMAKITIMAMTVCQGSPKPGNGM